MTFLLRDNKQVTILVLVTTLTIGVRAQQQSTPRTTTSDSMPMTMLVAPLFVEDGRFSSSLSLVNASSEPTYATVFVRSFAGEVIVQRKVPLAANSISHVPLRDLIDEAKSSETRGSIVVEQSPDLKGMAVLAQLSMTYESARKSYIDEELAMPDPKMGSSVLRAVSGGERGSLLVAVSSLSTSSQQIEVRCITGGPEPTSRVVRLDPNATALVPACKRGSAHYLNDSVSLDGFDDESSGPASREAVGIELVSDAGPGQFAAFGISRGHSDDGSFLGALPFNDPKLAVSSTTVFTGVPVGPTNLLVGGPYRPYLSIGNFSLGAAHVTVRFFTTSEATNPSTSKAAAREILVQPQSATILSLAELPGDPDLRNSILVTSDAKPGDVAVSTASSAKDGQSEVEMLGKDSQQSENMGAHPWSIEGGTESTLFLFNHTDQHQSVVVTVYGRKSIWRKHMSLGGFETMALSVSDLIKNEIPDDHHKLLDADLVDGQIQWTMARDKTITGRLLVSNKTIGMARNFSCQAYNVLCGAYISPSSATISVGGNALFSLGYSSCIAYNVGDCSGSGGGTVSPFYEWGWSGGLSASCGGSFTCDVTGTTPGSQSVTGTVYTNYCRFPASAAVTVNKPKINGASEVWWFGGQTPSGYATSVTLTSSGGSSTSWTVTAGSNKVSLSATTGSSITVKSSGSAFSSAIGDIKITATVNGVASDPFSFTTREPYRLVAGSITTGCDSTYGYSDFLNYKIQDQLFYYIPSNVAINENWPTPAVQDYAGNNWGWPTAGNATTNVASFADHITGRSISGAVPVPVCSGNSTKVQHRAQEWRVGSLTIGVGMLVQTDVLGRFRDHGDHESIVSPVP